MIENIRELILVCQTVIQEIEYVSPVTISNLDDVWSEISYVRGVFLPLQKVLMRFDQRDPEEFESSYFGDHGFQESSNNFYFAYTKNISCREGSLILEIRRNQNQYGGWGYLLYYRKGFIMHGLESWFSVKRDH